MFKKLKNEKGAILSYSVAIIIALISLLSSLSLIGLAHSDSLTRNYQHDMIQEDILLRSEGIRSQLSIEVNPNRVIPGRDVEVNYGDKRITTYYIKNLKEMTQISNFMGFATKQAVKISSEVTAKRKRRFQSNQTNQSENLFGSIESPVIRLTERFLRNESLSQWQYFTETEASENEDGGQEAAAVKFYGPDVLWGPLHSNSDIWIQQAGGGDNMGWPTFHAHVSTTGIFRRYQEGNPLIGSGAPIEDIFLGGYSEEAPYIGFEPDAADLRANGTWIFPEGAYDLCYVELLGSSANVFKATITSQVEEFEVLSWIPADNAQTMAAINADINWLIQADTIITNYVTIYDTIWDNAGIATGDGSSFFVPSDLWINGTVSGNQCWGASGDIRIVGDILYTGNGPGTHPDGFSGPDSETGEAEYDGPVNTNDYFGLVSEQKMYVAYKSYHPDTGNMMDDNSTGPGGHVYLYGAYAAIGKGDVNLYGDMACHHDGIFTFEYQHTHGSTPNYWSESPFTGNDTLYTYVDLHKFIFPINNLVPPLYSGFNLHGAPPGGPYSMCGYPLLSPYYQNSCPNNGPNYEYPLGTDYPWYNPVWPESAEFIVTERGTLHIYGSIAQTRRGFIHRSGSDPYNHHSNEWDMEGFNFDGIHPPTGYDKDYFFDRRFLYIQPKNFPEVYRGYGGNALTPLKAFNWSFKSPSDN